MNKRAPMTLLSIARRAMDFYPHASPSARRRQAARYARALSILGDRWLLARPSRRLR